MIFKRKITKRHDFVRNNVCRIMVPNSAYHPIMLHICTKFRENIFVGFNIIEQTRFPY